MTDQVYMSKQVDSLIKAAAAQSGALCVANLLLQVNGEVVHFDYVLIDRYGFLVLAAEPMAGLSVSGSSLDAAWKSRSVGERAERFDNPLKGNQRRLSLLKEALAVTGRRFADEYFTDLVVFGGAELSGLKLSGTDQLKVIDAREMAATLQARNDFAPNPGLIEQHEIEAAVSLFRALDRTDSRGAHAAEATNDRAGILALLRRPKVSTVALADHTAGLAPVAPRLSGDRYPAPTQKRSTSVAGAIVALLVTTAVAVWLFRFGGYAAVVNSALALLPRAETAVAPPPPSSGPTISVDHAETRLQTMQPQIFARVTNHGTPRVVTEEGVSKFTWTYTLADNGKPREFTLGFDASGDMVYVDSE